MSKKALADEMIQEENPSNESMAENETKCCNGIWPLNWSNETWGFLTLRLFLGLRWFIAGIEKWELDGAYTNENYFTNMDRMAGGIASNSFMPEWITKFYAYPLGYLLVALGVALLLGIKTRIVLILSGLTYVSLCFGLMAVEERAGIAWLAIHIAMNVWALLLVKHNKLAIWKD
ncbi:MAG: MauE/DoxX family redox-associated membrane protein [Verrucomicrobiota bacterium]